jgi:hypothetical protein
MTPSLGLIVCTNYSQNLGNHFTHCYSLSQRIKFSRMEVMHRVRGVCVWWGEGSSPVNTSMNSSTQNVSKTHCLGFLGGSIA